MRDFYKKTVIAIIVLASIIIGVWGISVYIRGSHFPVEEHDYIIFQDSTLTRAKNGRTGAIDLSSTDASSVLNYAVAEGNDVYIKFGEYTLSSDILLHNKKNARLASDGAIMKCNGKKIVVKGDSYISSQYNTLSNFEVINGSVRIENSFRTTISNMIFRNCAVAIELANTETWTEGTKIENSHFINSQENIVFRTPISPATGSYANTEISRCYFNLHHDYSVGIKIEANAECTDSLLQNARMWMGESDHRNQTGISIEGSMLQTLLQNVVFESFSESAPTNLYGLQIGQDAEPPILGGGVSFLGEWTARVHNPYEKWIFGLGGAFRRENLNVSIGLDNEYGLTEIVHAYPLRITGFNIRIRIGGEFNHSETIAVRFRAEFIDNTISESVIKLFNQTTTLWLDENDLFELAPSESVIWAILVDAQTSAESTDTIIQIDMYGTTG